MKKTMKSSLLVLMMCVMVVTLFSKDVNALARKEGKYQPKKGYILVTKDGKIGHVEIIYYVNAKNNKIGTTIGSMGPGVGVKSDNLQKWVNKKKEFWILEVRGVSRKKQEKAADWCAKQIGKPYNNNFSNISTRKRFYCSQLVWAAYKDLYGIDLNTKSFDGFSYYYDTGKLKLCKTKKYCQQIAPIELVKSNKTKVVYHYKR